MAGNCARTHAHTHACILWTNSVHIFLAPCFGPVALRRAGRLPRLCAAEPFILCYRGEQGSGQPGQPHGPAGDVLGPLFLLHVVLDSDVTLTSCVCVWCVQLGPNIYRNATVAARHAQHSKKRVMCSMAVFICLFSCVPRYIFFLQAKRMKLAGAAIRALFLFVFVSAPVARTNDFRPIHFRDA